MIARVEVLLSLQRALLGAVTAPLRVVAVSWDEHRIAARFVYDRDDPDHAEIVSVVETQVFADFDVQTDFTIEVLPEPAPVGFRPDEVWVYRHREDHPHRSRQPLVRHVLRRAVNL